MDLENLLQKFEKDEQTTKGRGVEETLGPEKILFIHDSFHRKHGQTYQFSDQENRILEGLISKTKLPQGSYQFVAAIKEYNIREDDVTTEELHTQREFLYEDVAAINPDLIIPLGNLAMKALVKKSGVTGKRGKEFVLELEGVEYPVVPTLHPFSLYAEPKLRSLFIQDLDNAYSKFILDENKMDDSGYHLINGDLNRLLDVMALAIDSPVVAVDIETTGLDFKKDSMITIGFSFKEGSGYVFPVLHRENEWTDAELTKIQTAVSLLMAKPDTVKVFHNCKFDVKFLRNWGVEKFENIEDTQIMHALINENLPHGLMDCVKEHFPHELEKF